MKVQDYKEIIKWLMLDDTGCSSKCLIGFLTIKEVGGKDYPYDISDLGRCIRALEKLPFLQQDLLKAKEISKVWSFIINNWDELVNLYKSEKHKEVNNILRQARELDDRYKVKLGNLVI